MKIYRILCNCSVLILSAFLVGACAVHYTKTTSEEFELSPDEYGGLKYDALKKGDAAAAFRLGLYYEASKFDHKNALRWFRVAESLGDMRAKNWVVTLSARPIESH